jgi:hypothetical protein
MALMPARGNQKIIKIPTSYPFLYPILVVKETSYPFLYPILVVKETSYPFLYPILVVIVALPRGYSLPKTI